VSGFRGFGRIGEIWVDVDDMGDGAGEGSLRFGC